MAHQVDAIAAGMGNPTAWWVRWFAPLHHYKGTAYLIVVAILVIANIGDGRGASGALSIPVHPVGLEAYGGTRITVVRLADLLGKPVQDTKALVQAVRLLHSRC